MLFFIFNTEAIGVLVAHDLKDGEFVLQMPFYSPQQNLDDFSHEGVAIFLGKEVGYRGLVYPESSGLDPNSAGVHALATELVKLSMFCCIGAISLRTLHGRWVDDIGGVDKLGEKLLNRRKKDKLPVLFTPPEQTLEALLESGNSLIREQS